jgi:hypothetical protein
VAVFASVYKHMLLYSIHRESYIHVTTTRLFVVRLFVFVQEKKKCKKKLLQGLYAHLHKMRAFRVYALNMSFKVC